MQELNSLSSDDHNDKNFRKTLFNLGTYIDVLGGFFCKLTEGKVDDSPDFGPLVKWTAEVFGIEEVSTDKVYSSRENHNIVDDLGSEAYVPFTENAKGRASGSPAWKKMSHKFQLENDEFRQHYHKRSNVETVFHMLKTKFGDSVNAKNERAQSTKCYSRFCVTIS